MAPGGPLGGPPHGDPRALSFAALREGLLHAQARQAPAISFAFGKELLEKHARSLKDEIWSVYEAVYLAALTLHRPSAIKVCARRALDALACLEYCGESCALPCSNSFFTHWHLREYAADKEAWHELAEMYLYLGLLHQAAFVWEELLLRESNNLYYLLTYGENTKALVTLGIEAAARLDGVYAAQLRQHTGNLFAVAAKRRIAAISQCLKDFQADMPAAAGISRNAALSRIVSPWRRKDVER
ncbi:TPR domain-containing protein [Cyclospora cayetanensis]|uniref:ER membrane protein complex subunit 2 n=1 Tax=Cyclospora cayetanensis TaxID=88456 RepID=A0A1D3D6U2_9EIME|nr:TPR domain-containing protein [Cyclospora cayetanensis]